MAEQKQNASGTLPKNIRQIGTSTGNTKVYLEDYVYTYLHMPQQQDEWTHRGFVLLGRLERVKDVTRYFISGLIRVKDDFFHDGILEFRDETWACVYQEMKQYYDNLEIVGWGQDVSGASASLTAEIERNHKQNFNVQKNVLLLLDGVEDEEAFYIFEKNLLQRREGYYVYYEKNPQMQEYMIETQKSRELNIPLEEAPEPAVHSYRQAMLNKKAQMATRKWNGVLYTTSMLLVLSVCVLGVSTVNNVEKMQNLEATVNQISSRVGQAGSGGNQTSPAMSANVQHQGADGTGSPDSVANPDAQQKGTGKEGQKAGEEITKDAGQQTDSQLGTSEEDGAESGSNDANEGMETSNGSGGQLSDASSTESTDQAETSTSLTEAQTYLLQGYYIVKRGDSLVGISKKIYGTPKKAKRICELNGIDDMDKIYAGQKLQLP